MANHLYARARIRQILLVSIACIAPITLIEISSQYINRHDLEEKAWAIPKSLLGKSKLPSTHLPRLNKTELSPWVESTYTSYVQTPIRFRTDDYGTIIPSSLNNALTSQEPYFLFCGGSTTEGWASPEGERIPDHFTRITGISTVNAARSGKDLGGCISTIRALLKSGAPKPDRIIVANSVNTLMGFGIKKREQISKQAKSNSGALISSKNKSKEFNLKHALQSTAPGLYQLAINIKMSVGPLAPMEYGLAEGCCFLSSEFNKYSPEMDWESQELQTSYSQYTRELVSSLLAVLKESNYPLHNVSAFIEPNSFGLSKIIGQKDYRQRLHALDAKQLNLTESKKIIDNYDLIYASAFEEKGINIIWTPEDELSGEYFYDAIHTTAKGSAYFGSLYANHFEKAGQAVKPEQP